MAKVSAFGFMYVLSLLLIASVSTFSPTDDRIPTAQEICSFLPPGSTFLQPNSCTNWVKCSPSYDMPQYIEEGSCLNGLYFDKTNSSCNFNYLVDCPYSASISISSCANQPDGKYLPDSTSCNGYIYCKDGTDLHANCPTNMVFNPIDNGKCVYSDQYVCDIKQPAVIHPFCRSLPEKLPFANNVDCTKYYVCENGQLTDENCDKNMAYDHIVGQCVSENDVKCYPGSLIPEPVSEICMNASGIPHHGYISDGITCSGYYYCAKQEDTALADPTPNHYTCPNDQFFDVDSWTCRNRLNVKCEFDRCEGMGDKYVNVNGDCTKYARCQDSVTAFEASCPDNYFFDEQTQGCTAKNVSYKACLS